MKRFKSDHTFKFIVLAILGVYLVGALCNLFFIAKYTPSFSKTVYFSNTDVKKDALNPHYRSANFLQMIDKSTLDSDQSLDIKFIPVSIFIIFLALTLVRKKTLIEGQTNLTYNLQYSYLRFRTFRI